MPPLSYDSPPPSSRSLLSPLPFIFCAPVLDPGSLASLEPNRHGPRQNPRCPTDSITSARIIFETRKQCSLRLRLRPWPSEPDDNLYPLNLPTNRQAGFDSLSAASSSTCAPSVSDTTARSRPPVPYCVAALDLLPWGQDGRSFRRPASSSNPRADIASQFHVDLGLSHPSTATGYLVNCGGRSCGRSRNFYVEPTADEVGEYSASKHYDAPPELHFRPRQLAPQAFTVARTINGTGRNRVGCEFAVSRHMCHHFDLSSVLTPFGPALGRNACSLAGQVPINIRPDLELTGLLHNTEQ